MGIQQICNSIKGLFEKVRSPFPQLPRLPLVCALPKRPGLSAIHSTSEAAVDFGALGIPTSPMPQGCPNASIGVAYAIISEIVRAINEDASIQGGAVPSSISVRVFGANEGGPIVGDGVNTNNGEGYATS